MRTNVTNVQFVHEDTYDPALSNYVQVVDAAVKKEFDTILVADRVPTAGFLIRELRRRGVVSPIYGTAGLDSPELWTHSSNAAFGVYFPSKWVWPPASSHVDPTGLAEQFVEAFRAKYGIAPGLKAAQAYEAMHLLAQAFIRAGTTKPSNVVTVLRYTPNWRGLLETYSGFPDGQLVISNVFLKFFASPDYPTNYHAATNLHDFAVREIRAKPYTNQWHFGGFLVPHMGNRLVQIEEEAL